MRKNGKLPIKYYACGEYGGETARPHYHAVMFNATEDAIVEAWPLGGTYVVPNTPATMAYVTKYINKSKKELAGKAKEFSLMSKRLGDNYITPAVVKYHKDDLERCYMTKEGGQKVAMPRYYREKIYTEKQRMQQRTIFEEMHERLEDARFESWVKAGNDPARYHSQIQAVNEHKKTQSEKLANRKRK